MYIIIIDQGTTSTRSILFDLHGRIISDASITIKNHYPKPGWVEQSPHEIWMSTLECLRKVTALIDIRQILACGITNQRETTICWDQKTGQSFGPAIVWQDRRTQSWCNHYQQYSDIISQKTGLKPDPYFSASKIRWILDHYPEIDINYLKFGTVDSFLLWHLTARSSHKTDVTNAARTLLFNIHTQCWDKDLLDLFKIPESILPTIESCDGNFGYMDASILGREIPILSMIGDQQAGLVGVGCLQANEIKVTFGTGGFLMQNLGQSFDLNNDGLLTTIAYKIKNQTFYAKEGSIYDAGSAVEWIKNTLGFVQDYDEIAQILSDLDSNEGVYFIPAFSGMGAPYWITEAGAMFVGLARSTGQAHLIRAILESIAYQTQDILSIMTPYQVMASLKVDGGMIHNSWFLQFLADLTKNPISIPNTSENTAKGAAMIVALSLGHGKCLQEICQHWNRFSLIQPSSRDYTNSYREWKKFMQKFLAFHAN